MGIPFSCAVIVPPWVRVVPIWRGFPGGWGYWTYRLEED